ncbi:hypothetical protein QTH87_14690 [Variovorax sp. J22P168]|uniref:hypothetical protein n=1 Tax=Variovorax jilinensis TaxID=3053513 RepID=UPI002578E9E9|nr:hypothetical protein [Variovorax sp. J22P168]MDM0013684.1 hypothetical protein [Variovorax sp. J22P168]
MPDILKRAHLVGALSLTVDALVNAAVAAAAPAKATAAGPQDGRAGPSAAKAPAAAYFPANAHALGPGEDLQAALDRHRVVRLGEGTYRNCTLRSGQHLRGFSGKTRIERLTIEPGARDFSALGVSGNVVFPPSQAVTRDGFVGARFGDVIGRGAALERVMFFACVQGGCDFRDSRVKDCTWVHEQSHDGGWQKDHPIFVLSGPGSGNTIVAFNALGAKRLPLSVANQRGFTLVGFDEETYKPHEDGGPSLLLRDSPGATVVGMGGHPHQSDGLDSDSAGTTVVLSNQNSDAGRRLARLRAGGNIVRSPRYAASAGLPDQVAPPTGVALLAEWQRPVPIVPAPRHTGALGDDTAHLQRLLDGGGAVVLEPRAYGVRGTLRIKPGGTLAGTWGKTSLVASGDFPILMIDGSGTAAVDLYDLQFQGGSVGLYLTVPGLQLTTFNWIGLTFRGQTRGAVHIDNAYGLDNGGMARCAFIDCAAGILQTPGTGPLSDANASLCYIDKFHSWQCLFENCGRPLDLRIRRADNMVSWTQCTFRNNREAPFVGSHANYPLFVGCHFIGPGTRGAAIDSASSTTVVARCFFEGAQGLGANLALNCEFS